MVKKRFAVVEPERFRVLAATVPNFSLSKGFERISGYQVYAVEEWLLDPTRLASTVVVPSSASSSISVATLTAEDPSPEQEVFLQSLFPAPDALTQQEGSQSTAGDQPWSHSSTSHLNSSSKPLQSTPNNPQHQSSSLQANPSGQNAKDKKGGNTAFNNTTPTTTTSPPGISNSSSSLAPSTSHPSGPSTSSTPTTSNSSSASAMSPGEGNMPSVSSIYSPSDSLDNSGNHEGVGNDGQQIAAAQTGKGPRVGGEQQSPQAATGNKTRSSGPVETNKAENPEEVILPQVASPEFPASPKSDRLVLTPVDSDAAYSVDTPCGKLTVIPSLTQLQRAGLTLHLISAGDWAPISLLSRMHATLPFLSVGAPSPLANLLIPPPHVIQRLNDSYAATEVTPEAISTHAPLTHQNSSSMLEVTGSPPQWARLVHGFVTQAQSALMLLGYNSSFRVPDGVFGKWSQLAFSAFQRDYIQTLAPLLIAYAETNPRLMASGTGVLVLNPVDLPKLPGAAGKLSPLWLNVLRAVVRFYGLVLDSRGHAFPLRSWTKRVEEARKCVRSFQATDENLTQDGIIGPKTAAALQAIAASAKPQPAVSEASSTPVPGASPEIEMIVLSADTVVSTGGSSASGGRRSTAFVSPESAADPRLTGTTLKEMQAAADAAAKKSETSGSSKMSNQDGSSSTLSTGRSSTSSSSRLFRARRKSANGVASPLASPPIGATASRRVGGVGSPITPLMGSRQRSLTSIPIPPPAASTSTSSLTPSSSTESKNGVPPKAPSKNVDSDALSSAKALYSVYNSQRVHSPAPATPSSTRTIPLRPRSTTVTSPNTPDRNAELAARLSQAASTAVPASPGNVPAPVIVACDHRDLLERMDALERQNALLQDTIEELSGRLDGATEHLDSQTRAVQRVSLGLARLSNVEGFFTRTTRLGAMWCLWLVSLVVWVFALMVIMARQGVAQVRNKSFNWVPGGARTTMAMSPTGSSSSDNATPVTSPNSTGGVVSPNSATTAAAAGVGAQRAGSFAELQTVIPPLPKAPLAMSGAQTQAEAEANLHRSLSAILSVFVVDPASAAAAAEGSNPSSPKGKGLVSRADTLRLRRSHVHGQ